VRSVIWPFAALVVILDRITKWLVVTRMKPLESIPLIPGVFHLTYVRNPGAAFGVLAYRRDFFLIVTALVIASVLYYSKYVSKDQVFLRASLGLQLGGAIGNLIDRLRSGLVVDFLDFRVWPVFNVADSAIVVGTGVVILLLLKSPRDAPAREG
jgi:signal peptidase II